MWSDLIGKPFKDGGRGPDNYDCGGLAQEVFRRYGIQLPDYQISCSDNPRIDGQLRREECKWMQIKEPVEPCIVVFAIDGKWVSHMGVYIGQNRFIHAREKIGVAVERLDHPFWKKKLYGYYKPRG